MNELARWLKKSSTEEQKELARRARTSVGHLQQLSGRHRKPSAALAIRLDRAAVGMRAANARLPLLPRERLAAACRSCEFARRCRI